VERGRKKREARRARKRKKKDLQPFCLKSASYSSERKSEKDAGGFNLETEKKKDRDGEDELRTEKKRGKKKNTYHPL